MRVRVLFFGILKDVTGRSEDCIDLREGASVRDVLAHYESMPRFNGVLSSIAVAVNQQYAGQDTVLKASDEVALLPPVSGGSSEGSAASDCDSTAPMNRRFAAIVRSPIDTEQALANLKHGEDGAAV